MAQSPEYPDLKWVPPKAWHSGRPDGRPLWIVVHTTEGSEGLRSAEDGTAYDARRTDGTSTHYMHDQDNTIQEVRTSDRANAAKGHGNQRGIHHELCGRAAQSPAQWHDTASIGTLRRFARQAARDAKKWGIPVRKLTAAEVRAGKAGFCEHKDISDAFGESDHQDPGKNYPWAEVLDLVREEMEDDVALTPDDIEKIAAATARATWAYQLEDPASTAKPPVKKSAAAYQRYNDLVNDAAANKVITAITKALAALPQVDAIARAVAAALPADRNDITPAELQEAIVGALADLVARPAA